MKKLLAVALATVMMAGQVNAADCMGSLRADIRYRVQFADRNTAGEMFVKEAPKKCLLGGKRKGDRSFGCLITGLFYGFAFFAGDVGFVSASILAGFAHFSDKEIRGHRKQMKLNKKLLAYYNDPNNEDEKEIRRIKRYVGASNMKDERFHEIMAEINETRELCSNGVKVDEQLRVTEEGMEILRARGYVAMDIILNPDMPQDLKDYIIRHHIVTDYSRYGKILNKKQLRELIKSKK